MPAVTNTNRVSSRRALLQLVLLPHFIRRRLSPYLRPYIHTSVINSEELRVDIYESNLDMVSLAASTAAVAATASTASSINNISLTATATPLPRARDVPLTFVASVKSWWVLLFCWC